MSVNIKTEGLSGDAYLTPYKSYVALLTQVATDAPTAIVLNISDSNYLGDIVWTRSNAGYYVGTLTGAFPVEKTSMLTGSNSHAFGFIGMGNDTQPDSVFISTTNIEGIGEDDNMANTAIEIKVYPA